MTRMRITRIGRIEQFGILLTLACLSLLMLSGCDQLNALLDLFRPPTTQVELVNDGDFVVDVVMYIDDEQDIPEVLLKEIGERVELSINPGETRVISRPCRDLQAVLIDDADLRVIGQIGPETRTDVLRDGSDFGCRDTIRFTFDHSEILVDFDVTTEVSSN